MNRNVQQDGLTVHKKKEETKKNLWQFVRTFRFFHTTYGYTVRDSKLSRNERRLNESRQSMWTKESLYNFIQYSSY